MEPLPAKTSTRYDCVGLAYYSAWMRTNGAPPVCIGFKSTAEEPVAESAQTQQAQAQASTSDFKVLCLGYTTVEPASQSHLPHCEGIEVVVELAPAPAGDKKAASAESTSQKELPDDAQMHTRLMMRTYKNFGLMAAALRNEGPIVFKPMPKTQEELQKRLTDKYNENLDKMYRGGERILHNAYSATVKPLAAIFNFTARPKS